MKTTTSSFLLSTLLALLFVFILQGEVQALEVPQLSGRVVDAGHILSSGTIQLLDQQLQALEKEDSTQVVVLTISSLQGESLEEYSLKVAESWEIGQKGRDNGALLLIAVKERKLRIEVGSGLEGVLTDLMSGRIIRSVIVPRFKQGNFDQGIVDGVDAIVKTVKGEYTADNFSSRKKNSSYNDLFAAAFFGLFFIGMLFRRKTVPGGLAGGAYGAVVWFTSTMLAGIPLLIVAILIGGIGGAAATALMGLSGGHSSGRGGFPPIGMSGGRFGGGGFGGGGFGGGGGCFCGGGASGGW